MFNTLSAKTFDPIGHIQINITPETNQGEVRRRVNRVATLDGGVVVNDAGFSDGDRTIELAWSPTNGVVDAAVDRMVQLYDRAVLATRVGVFDVALDTYIPGSKESTLRLLVVSKLSI